MQCDLMCCARSVGPAAVYEFIAAAHNLGETMQSQIFLHNDQKMLPDFKCCTSGATDGAPCIVAH